MGQTDIALEGDVEEERREEAIVDGSSPRFRCVVDESRVLNEGSANKLEIYFAI